MLVATEAFVKGASFNTTALNTTNRYDNNLIDVGKAQQNATRYENLTNAACIDAYATDFVTDRRTLILVSTNTSALNDSLLAVKEYSFTQSTGGLLYDPYNW